MISSTEQQKHEIEKLGIRVIQFKLVIARLIKAYESMVSRLVKSINELDKDLSSFSKVYDSMPSKQKFKMVKKLNRCGFTEKDINLMIHYRRLCRDNC